MLSEKYLSSIVNIELTDEGFAVGIEKPGTAARLPQEYSEFWEEDDYTPKAWRKIRKDLWSVMVLEPSKAQKTAAVEKIVVEAQGEKSAWATCSACSASYIKMDSCCDDGLCLKCRDAKNAKIRERNYVASLKKLGIKIKAARKSMSMTQVNVANALECSNQLISQIECGSSQVSITTLKRVCDYVNVKYDIVIKDIV